MKSGKRFNGEEIINEIDRLHPLAAADIAVLSEGGYSRKMLDDLVSMCEQLAEESADRRTFQGVKQGVRGSEQKAMRNGKIILRRGITMAYAAVSRRKVPKGEIPQVTIEKLTELTDRVKVLSGAIGQDSAKLRTRIGAIRDILALPEFAPPAGDEEARAKFVAKLDAVANRLGALAEAKKSLGDGSKDKTASIREINGQAYANLRLLTQAGRSAFLEAGDSVHAKLYTLRNLHRIKQKSARGTATPETPAPNPPAPQSAPETTTQNPHP